MEPAADPTVGTDHLRLTQEINAIIEQKKVKHEAAKGLDAAAADAHARTALEEAAQEAAIADGVLANALLEGDKHEGGPKGKHDLRRGKWTPEEEAYARRLIDEFKRGNLPLSEGTTLRTFLSKLLNCDPMRISKKFVGQNCIGKQVFRRRNPHTAVLSDDIVESSRRDLADLERRFLDRINQSGRAKPAVRQPGNTVQRLDTIKAEGKEGPVNSSMTPAAGLPIRNHPSSGGLSGHIDHLSISNFPPHTLPWHPSQAALSLSLPLNDGAAAHARNAPLRPKAGDKPLGRQPAHNGNMQPPSTNGFPSVAYDQSHATIGHSPFPRTPSMEVLMNLPNMNGLPSIQSMENLATFFPTVPGYAPQPGTMPWESLQYHGAYEMGSFPLHNHDGVMGAYMMKTPGFAGYPEHAVPDGPKDQPAWPGMEPPATRPNGHNPGGLSHATSTDEFLALMENAEHDNFPAMQYPAHATTTRTRASTANYDARHHGSFQDMNKAEFQTSGKRRYDGSSSAVVKLPRSTPEPPYVQTDL